MRALIGFNLIADVVTLVLILATNSVLETKAVLIMWIISVIGLAALSLGVYLLVGEW